MTKRPYVLSIAGFDPSGGAGVLADIKTFESYKTVGLAVSTAHTYQTEDDFYGLEWHSEDKILDQLKPLLERYPIEYVKIGLIENIERLNNIIDTLKSGNPKIKIIWDPILKSSTGFSFHENIKSSELESIANNLFLVTPNLLEIGMLYPQLKADEAAKHLSQFCQVFLKGGHHEDSPGRDMLFNSGKSRSFNPAKVANYAKHGSGCIVSAAITSGLAKGYPLNKAILKAKRYVIKVLLSNKTLLGYHF